MLGPKKLKEIKQELRAVLGQDDQRLRSWLEERFSRLKPSESKTAEDLLWVQQMLSKQLATPRQRRSKTP
jgi:hypothetical protein